MGTVFPAKPTVLQFVKKCPTPNGSLKFIAVLTTARHINPVHALPPRSFRINFNITLTPTPKPPQRSLSFRFPHQNLTAPSHPIPYHPNSTSAPSTAPHHKQQNFIRICFKNSLHFNALLQCLKSEKKL
jgi:hypothetical protein